MKPRAAVVLSIVLLAVAAVLLARGLVATPGTSLFLASITVSIAAAAALAWSGRAAVPHPIPDDRTWPRAGGEWSSAAPAARPDEPTPVEIAPVAVTDELDEPLVPTEPGDDTAADTAGEPAGADEVEFPIADYDDLTLPEVLGLLPQLYSDELDVVEQRERDGACRPAVLDQLAHLREHGTEADAEYAARLAEHEASLRGTDEPPAADAGR